MARTDGAASNPDDALVEPIPDFEILFSDLRDWEDQLRDVDFSVMDEEAPPEDESPAPKPRKRGGPTPC